MSIPPRQASTTTVARARNGLVRTVLVAALLTAVLLGLAAVSERAFAQEQTQASRVPTAELQALEQTLEDETKRNDLLQTIRALIATQQKVDAKTERPENYGEQVLEYVADIARDTHASMTEVSQSFHNWPVLMNWIEGVWSDPATRARGKDEAIAFIALFAAGSAAEWLLWALFARPRRRLDASSGLRGTQRVMPVIMRTLIDFVPLLAFAGAAYAAAILIEPTPQVQAVGLNFVNAYVVARALIAGARLLLSPKCSSLRLLPLSDATARDLLVWFRRFIVVGVCGYFITVAALLLGLPQSGADALLTILGLVLALLAIAFVLSHRRRVTEWLRHQAAIASQRLGSAPLLYALATVWHVLAIAYIVGFFLIAAFRIQGGFAFMAHGTGLSVLVIGAAWLLIYGIQRAVSKLQQLAEDGETEPHHRKLSVRLMSYLPPAAVAVRALVVFGAAVLLFQAWGLDAVGWLNQSAGKRVLGALTSIALVLLIAILVWEVTSAAIERYLRPSGGEGAAQHSARVRTLLPLLRKALFIFLTIMVVLISLSEIGIDIAPLLAGAGVIGLAIGFGAQKLVQDVITGIFMLVEDALAVGDVVNVAGIGGQVEDMSIRSIRLRDLSGSVHTIPFSSVSTVTNMTKDFSYAVLDIGVAYRENTDNVVKVCLELAEELRQDPTYSLDILEPMEVLGVDAFAESSVIIKVRIKTRPIRQWAVMREFNRRMKQRFDELGIEIPFPYRSIQFVGGTNDQLPWASADTVLPPKTSDVPPPPPPPPAEYREPEEVAKEANTNADVATDVSRRPSKRSPSELPE